MSATEAQDYGIIDRVVMSKKENEIKPEWSEWWNRFQSRIFLFWIWSIPYSKKENWEK
jgi:hypothetical protein